MYTLYRKDIGIYETSCDVLVDRKLADGFVFYDELKKEEKATPEVEPKKRRGRPPKFRI